MATTDTEPQNVLTQMIIKTFRRKSQAWKLLHPHSFLLPKWVEETLYDETVLDIAYQLWKSHSDLLRYYLEWSNKQTYADILFLCVEKAHPAAFVSDMLDIRNASQEQLDTMLISTVRKHRIDLDLLRLLLAWGAGVRNRAAVTLGEHYRCCASDALQILAEHGAILAPYVVIPAADALSSNAAYGYILLSAAMVADRYLIPATDAQLLLSQAQSLSRVELESWAKQNYAMRVTKE